MIYFLSELGNYKLPDGKDDYACTTSMIDTIVENIRSDISEMSKFEKVDLAIGMMIMTEAVSPILELVNEIMTDVSKDDFNDAYDAVF